ncbi:hypothetical protein [Stackebrandtia soli]|uniref:hypothetical protein n=1 Tax=Stackebrandtia soli TaxID=1892856 RepID=UPI0039EA32C8
MTTRAVPSAELTDDEWSGFIEATPSRWFTHDRHWCERVDGREVEDDGFALVTDGAIRALVPVTAMGNVVVSGRNEPSGPLLAADVDAAEREHLWASIDAELTAIATRRGASAIGLKFPVLTASGHRGPDDPDVGVLTGCGYQLDRRLFYCIDLNHPLSTLWAGVSSRTRSQLRAADRACELAPVGVAELPAYLDVYRRHAEAKDSPVPVTLDDMRHLLGDESGVSTLALLGREDGEATGFALSLGVGASATVFAWGRAPDPKPSQLSKLLVWRSLELLREKGIRWVEYGGAILGETPYAGLTEFYRRLGGDTLPSAWLYRRVTE